MLRPSLIGGARGINKNLQHCYGLQCVSFRKSQCKHILVFCFQLGIKGAIQGSNIEKKQQGSALLYIYNSSAFRFLFNQWDSKS